jgi:hypothetical protein
MLASPRWKLVYRRSKLSFAICSTSSSRRHTVGAKFTGFMCLLAGVHGVSKRGIEELMEQAFDVSISLGTVSNRESVNLGERQPWLPFPDNETRLIRMIPDLCHCG